MPRKARGIRAGEYYHIVSRGNNKKSIFFDAEDFDHYLVLLRSYQEKYSVSVFHYCLMTNHTHSLMRSDKTDTGISRLMHDLQTAYAVYHQRKYESTGHMFENRFKDIPIKSDSHLLECGRYIERNPVRAGLVKHPKDYPWSSFNFYTEGQNNPIVTPNPLFWELGKTEKDRQRQYEKYLLVPRAYEAIIDEYFDKYL